MLSFKWIRGAAVSLATLGMMIPAAPVVAGESRLPARPSIKTVDAKIFDIAMSNGAFKGRVVDHTGAALEGAEVIVKQNNKEVGRSLTDKEGTFAVNNLRAGVYTVSSGNTDGTYRLWSEKTAPPSAKEMGLLVMGENGARGNFGCCCCDPAGLWIVGIGAVAVAALAVGIVALVRADQNSSTTPASP